MTRGRFITFEGGEGAGKSTQIARLSDRLSETRIHALPMREPGGSALGERVRDLLLDPNAGPRSALTETLLFSAARCDHLEQVIEPALVKGTWVLCDRFADSTRAYQGAADGVPDATLSALERIVVKDTVPDLTVLLDLPAEEGLRRAQVRADETGMAGGRDRFEARDASFHERLRQGFLDIATAAPDRFLVLDATHSVAALSDAIWEAVAARFEVK